MSAASRDEHGWDTNAVTPGTNFMVRLSRSLRDEAEKRQGPSWIVSGSDEEGEGEQKIMRHAATIGPALRAAVVGMDADLLLMTMTFLEGNRNTLLHVAREQDLRGPLQIVNTTELSRYVNDEMKCASGAVEFASLCTLLGNDFVPSLPGLRIRDGGIDAVVRAYVAVRSRGGEPLATGGPATLGGLNLRTLIGILEVLAKDEGPAMQEAEKQQWEARMRASQKKADVEKANEMFPLLEGFDGVSVRPAEPGWRPRYYRKLFGRGGIPPSIGSLCVEYVAGLAWSSAYMSHAQNHRCLSSGWHYPHAYAPTALDVHMMLSSDLRVGEEMERMFEEADRAHLMGERIAGEIADSNLWQLLLVLPPKSMNLLPNDRIRDVAANFELGCTHMFPDGFMLATYLKEKMHECVPLLPAIDTRLLIRALLHQSHSA